MSGLLTAFITGDSASAAHHGSWCALHLQVRCSCRAWLVAQEGQWALRRWPRPRARLEALRSSRRASARTGPQPRSSLQ